MCIVVLLINTFLNNIVEAVSTVHRSGKVTSKINNRIKEDKNHKGRYFGHFIAITSDF